MNPYLIIGFLLALAGAGAGGFKLGDDHRTAAQAREQKHITEAVEAANNAAAQAIATLKPKYTTIQNKLEKQIETNTIYASCTHGPVGMQLVQQALNGGIPIDSGKLPKADTAGK
jgi:hypothetical protein